MSRVYLDWNATAPLRPEARAAMVAAMDVVGNPSSVHAEGRAAKGIIEKARGQVAALVGCEPSEIVFTSGATESNNQVLTTFNGPYLSSSAEHDSVSQVIENFNIANDITPVSVTPDGQIVADSFLQEAKKLRNTDFSASNGVYGYGLIVASISCANSETGVLNQPENLFEQLELLGWDIRHVDATQWVGKIAVPAGHFGRVEPNQLQRPFGRFGATHIACSSHKIGGPKGVGALVMAPDSMVNKFVGGGQEKGARAGTENVIGIAGFGAAAEAAQRDLENGVWENVEKLRDQMEDRLAAEVPEIIIFGKDALRLPNTSNFAIPGWKGETQVMQMDLAGFAVSAGSACSSGKVKTSRVLKAMGYDDITASSAIRVSIGPTTSEAELMAFADTWIEHYRRFKAKAA